MNISIFQVTLEFKDKALQWATQFKYCTYLNPNDFPHYPFSGFRNLLGVGTQSISFESGSVFSTLRKKSNQEWWFGYLGYDLKNELESIQSLNPDGLGFPDILFFKAEVVLEWQTANQIRVEASNPETVFQSILDTEIKPRNESNALVFNAFKSKVQYFEDIKTIHNKIEEGQFYEINLCQFFESDGAVDGLSTYHALNTISPMPFSGWLKADYLEIACASPERYLKKGNRQLISQPIKGSAKKMADSIEDEIAIQNLKNSEKERAENMMIVDLVRNDLSKISETGSTTVPELFGIYSFQQIHQMISTVQSILRSDKDWVNALEATFPMGSMTGAPKTEVMKWIEKLETNRRGAFSGALGFIDPDNNFDFNVLIRSIFINYKKNKTGFAVGSAITIDSESEAEWLECANKASAILQVFESNWENIRGI